MTTRVFSAPSAQLVSRWSTVAVVGSVFVCGLLWHNAVLLGVGAALLCFLLRRVWDGSATETPRRGRQAAKNRDVAHSVRATHEDDSQQSEDSNADPVSELKHRASAPRSTDAL